MDNNTLLAKTCKELMFKEPFWGFFLLNLNKVWREDVPTAAVSKNNLNYQLAINETFFKELSDNHRLGLIQHELMHIAFFHLTKQFDFANKKVANYAMDIEINQLINNQLLPEGGLLPSSFPKLNLKLNAGTHYYYEKLMQAEKDKEEEGNSKCDKFNDFSDKASGKEAPEGTPDVPDHSTWKEFDACSDADKRIIKTQLDRALQEAAEMTVKKQGTVPGQIKDYLIELATVEAAKFNWKAYLRKFVGFSTRTYTKKTRRKENIKFVDSPGIKIKTKQHLLLGIDTSASVSENELKEFMNEIYHIYKTGVDITIIQCDTQIQSIEPYKGKLVLEINGRGGTQFSPVLEYFNANADKFTSLIYFTDGECYCNIKPKNPMLWVLSERSKINPSLPGRQIKLEL
jgi:predicted metal-dependent peptidase